MKFKQHFVQRITLAFFIMTLVVSALFSIGIVVIVHVVEDHIVSAELSDEINTILSSQINFHLLNSKTRFFASTTEEGIPKSFNNLASGLTEKFLGANSYYVYTIIQGNERFVLVKNQNKFEEREKALYGIVFIGFLLSIIASWVLGWFLAKWIMAPISNLARQVSLYDPQAQKNEPIAKIYAADEIGSLAAAFDKTLTELQNSLQRERLFTSDVSHELRTPLMIIVSSCELLSESTLSDTQKKLMAKTCRAASDIHVLVQTFLALARAETQQITECESSPLSLVAQEQAELWQPTIQAKNLTFKLTIESQTTTLYKKILLQTVLSNLLRNAIHYTDKGYIELIIKADEFEVVDSGIGIDKSQHDSVFSPFMRVNKNRGEGLGLGLSIVKRICYQEKWQVTVTNRQEGGSCFNVRLI